MSRGRQVYDSCDDHFSIEFFILLLLPTFLMCVFCLMMRETARFHALSSRTAGFDSMKLRSTLWPNRARILLTPYL
jgi:hypothetical protein